MCPAPSQQSLTKTHPHAPLLHRSATAPSPRRSMTKQRRGRPALAPSSSLREMCSKHWRSCSTHAGGPGAIYVSFTALSWTLQLLSAVEVFSSVQQLIDAYMGGLITTQLHSALGHSINGQGHGGAEMRGYSICDVAVLPPPPQ